MVSAHNEGGSNKGHDPELGRRHTNRRKKGRRRPLADHKFANYLTFGGATNICLAIFLLCYACLLLGMSPLLSQEAPVVTPTHRGEVLQPVVYNIKKNLAPNVAAENAQHMAENVASAIQKKIQTFRKSEGVTDSSLLNKAVADMERLRKYKNYQRKKQQNSEVIPPEKHQRLKLPSDGADGEQRPGFVLLGMHRSGTSMLSGLMATGLGYHTGGPLIGSAFDNEKGFFELVPAVLQNDEFMNKQRIWWSQGVREYDYEKALDDKANRRITFKNGVKALRVLNNPDNVPYLQKDPRMCITLKTWLPLLSSEPAVLFTYRHPLEVASSLQRRENNFPLEHGLRLWIVYNMRGVQNSNDLCRVTTSNDAVLASPLKEVKRIAKELTSKCNVAPPPEELKQEDVDKFVDTRLQHNGAQKAAEKAKRNVLALHNDGKCKVYEYDSEFTPEENPRSFQRESEMYMKAMKVYCDFESGAAYSPDYEWPLLD